MRPNVRWCLRCEDRPPVKDGVYLCAFCAEAMAEKARAKLVAKADTRTTKRAPGPKPALHAFEPSREHGKYDRCARCGLPEADQYHT